MTALTAAEFTTVAQILRDCAPDVAVGIDTTLEAQVQGYTARDPQLAETLEWSMSAPTASSRAVRLLGTARVLDLGATL